VVVLIIAAGAAVWHKLYAHTEVTEEEFQVYAAFMAKRGWQPNEVALDHESAKLSAGEPDSSLPVELRSDPSDPPQEFVSFCGRLCGHDFIRKNSNQSLLNPSADAHFPFEIVGSSGKPEMGIWKRAVTVSRVGFDFWQHHAVFVYSTDCEGPLENPPAMCVEFGQAFLSKKNSTWQVDHWMAFNF
jgi:hypothetical protein